MIDVFWLFSDIHWRHTHCCQSIQNCAIIWNWGVYWFFIDMVYR